MKIKVIISFIVFCMCSCQKPIVHCIYQEAPNLPRTFDEIIVTKKYILIYSWTGMLWPEKVTKDFLHSKDSFPIKKKQIYVYDAVKGYIPLTSNLPDTIYYNLNYRTTYNIALQRSMNLPIDTVHYFYKFFDFSKDSVMGYIICNYETYTNVNLDPHEYIVFDELRFAGTGVVYINYNYGLFMEREIFSSPRPGEINRVLYSCDTLNQN